MSKDILSVIQTNMSTFSKGQKRIADYILQNYDKAAFMTASKLGKLSGVSESTVVRFASELGYDGYPSMQRALQEMIRSRLTSTQRIKAAAELFDQQDIVLLINCRNTNTAMMYDHFSGGFFPVFQKDLVLFHLNDSSFKKGLGLSHFLAMYHLQAHSLYKTKSTDLTACGSSNKIIRIILFLLQIESCFTARCKNYFARAARVDFFLAAQFLWMIPFAQAWSIVLTAALTRASLFSAFSAIAALAFFRTVLRLVLYALLRASRFA